ncbi:MAG: dTDP-4-dehydrorhamnose 3,5-epimerase [Gammaproteobacteria bacterium]|nr:dTDP-4-dehydrorhamnose 3,5-epimerase [Gammaproteobacteria bacterium]
MEIVGTGIAAVKLVKPRVFEDERGYFMETWQQRSFAEAGVDAAFVQDNHSHSIAGTLRGLHYQIDRPQGKLVRAVSGEIFDVAVDLRQSSATFGRWVGAKLTGENRMQLWVPEGFAHGFLVLSETADVIYKCTDYYLPEAERTLQWNDSRVAIDWPLDPAETPRLSRKDASGTAFAKCDYFP